MKTPLALGVVALVLLSSARAHAQEAGARIKGIVTYRRPGQTVTVKGTWVYGKGPLTHSYRDMKSPVWTCGEEGTIESVSVGEESSPLQAPACDKADPECAKDWAQYKRTPVKWRTSALRRYEAPASGLCDPAANGAWLGRLVLDAPTRTFRFQQAHFKALGDLDVLPPDAYTEERWNADGELLPPDRRVAKSFDAGKDLEGAYDPKKTKLEGVWRDERLDAEDREDHGHEDHQHKEYVVTYSFDVVPPEDGTLALSPSSRKDYESWIPAPPKSDGSLFDGKSLGFRAELKPPKKGGAIPKAKIEFTLRDVSRQKGQCVNHPHAAVEKVDLRFKQGQPGIVVTSETTAHTSEEVSSATIEIEARDTAAWGRIEARAGGLASSLPVPFDENGNSIADQWEKDMKLLALRLVPGTDEDAQPAGQRRNGDGYTAFEEYRGFVVFDPSSGQKKFVRTSPLKKDLFVHDKDGLFRKHYAPYDPAKLTYRYVTLDLIQYRTDVRDPAHRWVNFNSAPYARQYAIDVQRSEVGAADDKKAVGEVLSFFDAKGSHYKKFQQPLKSIYVAKFFPSGIEATAASLDIALDTQQLRDEFIRRNLESTIIHEVGHAIGIRHHTKSRRKHGNDFDQDADEGNGGWSSGVVDCALRYLDGTVSARNVTIQTRYCTPADKDTDDCFGQIDVKSDP